MEYVDKNMNEIKNNYINKIKTLPMPSGYECQKNVFNSIFLKFHCSLHYKNCDFPGQEIE